MRVIHHEESDATYRDQWIQDDPHAQVTICYSGNWIEVAPGNALAIMRQSRNGNAVSKPMKEANRHGFFPAVAQICDWLSSEDVDERCGRLGSCVDTRYWASLAQSETARKILAPYAAERLNGELWAIELPQLLGYISALSTTTDENVWSHLDPYAMIGMFGDHAKTSERTAIAKALVQAGRFPTIRTATDYYAVCGIAGCFKAMAYEKASRYLSSLNSK